ncbi:actin cytoskeleton-regulatory complex protein sla1 [Phyllosticta citricarpa]|uniref:Actin cytoskeleton-regulatory complex protein SLA1 n=1 Tax=Phyllosticta citricarpa TaxID=55181 RepID=A0ABR1M737_9PEZI
MVFLGVYRAVYDYSPQGENELEIKDGDLLFILEKSTEDDWWRAKKKAVDEDEEEPEGLIPNNYVEEATPISKAKALYDYTRQTDEELSFTEDAILDVYDTSDPDWTLVGLKGEYGFAPANYIELTQGAEAAAPAMPARPRVPASLPEPEPQPSLSMPAAAPAATESPAAALAGLIQQKTGSQSGAPQRTVVSPPPAIQLPRRQTAQLTPEESDEEPPAPRLPTRPISQISSQPSPVPTPTIRTQYADSPRSPASPAGVQPSPPYNRASTHAGDWDDDVVKKEHHLPQGYHLYNIHEMISHMGKSKKMPLTLGINIPKGLIMIAPEKSKDGPQREWTADKLSHYSIEGKHVFMDLVRPSKSVDFHAGAKDTAQEIVSMLGELAGAARGAGLTEVFAAARGAAGKKKGKMLYEFMAQGDDEVTVAEGDDVIILDDVKSDEWWMVRRLKNGKEGVVPSSYVEVTGIVESTPDPALLQARSTVEQNRMEEERLAKEALKRSKEEKARATEVGTDIDFPTRSSSLARVGNDLAKSQRSKRESKAPSSSKSSEYTPNRTRSVSQYRYQRYKRAEPDPSKTRTWTDRTGSFKVEAEFIGLKDGKIHLHKLNGVKIAVPVPKMSIDDLEYVERATGVSLDDDKPLSEVKRRNTERRGQRTTSGSGPRAGISVEQAKPTYDWFQFFLDCGVHPQICERYAQSFAKDQMGEENLPDISEKVLRTLGLKEGDILRVMKFLDNKFGRTGENSKRSVSFGDTSVIEDGEGANGGLFAGPGGALKNNTRKGRPAPAVQTNDVVDADALKKRAEQVEGGKATPLASAKTGDSATVGGFDDNAWEVKPSKQPEPKSTPETQPSTQATAPTTTATPAPPTGAMAELSLLTPALQPTPAPQPQVQPPATAAPPAPAQTAQPTGATPGLFEQLANQPGQQNAPPRARPQAPQQTGQPGSLIAPPPQRSSSAPQNASQFAPPPLQPQMTGMVAPPGTSMQELNQQRQMQLQMQQQYPGMQPQPTGFMGPQQTGFPNQFQQQPQFGGSPLQAQPTGFMQPQPTGFSQAPHMGNQYGSPFADSMAARPPSFLPPQPTGGFQPQSAFGQQALHAQQTGQPLQPQQTGINAFLPPALQPQPTGASINGFPQQNNAFSAPPPPPVPPIPSQHAAAPLVPQKTGPPPPVRFGVQPGAKKLSAQPTGRRAELSKATPDNPFGF